MEMLIASLTALNLSNNWLQKLDRANRPQDYYMCASVTFTCQFFLGAKPKLNLLQKKMNLFEVKIVKCRKGNSSFL